MGEEDVTVFKFMDFKNYINIKIVFLKKNIAEDNLKFLNKISF